MARGLVAAVLIASVCAASATAAKPRPPKLDDWCLTKAEKRNAVALRASDGMRSLGVVLGRSGVQRGVVIAHENGGGLCNWVPFARRLSRNGFRVLALDLRGFASSPRPRRNVYRFDLDIAAGVKELRRRGVQRVGLIGGSMGATGVLVAASRVTPAVDVVVAASGPTFFRGLNAEPAVAAARMPVLFVAASDDAGFSDAARALYARSASPGKRLEIVPGIDHGYQLVSGASNEQNRRLFESFLSAHLGS